MKYLVLGAGKMGYAVAYDLIRSAKVDKVVLTDIDESHVKATADRLNDPKVVPARLDVTNEGELGQLMEEVDVAISCVTYEHNYELAKMALSTRTHFVDLGGNEEIVARQFNLDELARERGVTVIPDAGLAPGMVSLLAVSAADSLDEVYDIRMRVGGLPVEREVSSLGYAQVFSIDGLINEYYENCTVIRDGRLVQVPSLSEVEEIEFPKPFGVMEAFNTAGGTSTLPQTYLSKVQHLDYKTIRYPGHMKAMLTLKELGLMDKEPIKVGGKNIVPRQVLHSLLSAKLPANEPDVVLLRVSVSGLRSGKPVQLV
ncbi:MAG TPA: saccharopine dehydrogenase C-terminal domain-containing protein, partial [Candidatus Obscuribacter sp.]|nr:saccharopine dehydrogenase C-terminal domain-containing protein [Candidatus Obscuribacter sp.]